MQLEIWRTCNGSGYLCSFCAQFSETDGVEVCGSKMRSLGSMEIASTAPNRDSPLEELEGAVEIGTVLEAEEHKQTKHMPVHDQCNNNFAN